MTPFRVLLVVLGLALARPSGAAGPAEWTGFRGDAAEAVAAGDPARLHDLAASLETLDEAPAGWTDYWSAYLHYRIGFLADDAGSPAPALETCIRHARAAEDASSGDGPLRAESQALLGVCHSGLAGTGPAASMQHGQRAAMLRDESLLTAPDNPRVLILAGVQDVWTPVQWGGSPERAERQLRRALEHLDREDPAPDWQPRWGHSDAIGHLALALEQLDRPDEARAVLDRARADGRWNGWLDWVRTQIGVADVNRSVDEPLR